MWGPVLNLPYHKKQKTGLQPRHETPYGSEWATFFLKEVTIISHIEKEERTLSPSSQARSLSWEQSVSYTKLHLKSRFLSLLEQWEESPLLFLLVFPYTLQVSKEHYWWRLNASQEAKVWVAKKRKQRNYTLESLSSAAQAAHPGIPKVVICGAFCH